MARNFDEEKMVFHEKGIHNSAKSVQVGKYAHGTCSPVDIIDIIDIMPPFCREKLQGREGDLWKKLRQSERSFEDELDQLKERRRAQEAIFEDLKQTPASQLTAFFIKDDQFGTSKGRDISNKFQASVNMRNQSGSHAMQIYIFTTLLNI